MRGAVTFGVAPRPLGTGGDPKDSTWQLKISLEMVHTKIRVRVNSYEAEEWLTILYLQLQRP